MLKSTAGNVLVELPLRYLLTDNRNYALVFNLSFSAGLMVVQSMRILVNLSNPLICMVQNLVL